jgi:hypothetical protein
MQRRVFRRIFLLQAAALALFLSLKQGRSTGSVEYLYEALLPNP